MSNQDEVKVTGGIGAFFYAVIPWILGCAAVAWFGFYTGVIEFHHRQAVQRRMDNRVGVTAPLVAPVTLKILPEHGCIEIERGYLDGNRVTLYIANRCERTVDYYELRFQGIAPDGTSIWSTYENTAYLPALRANERGEWSEKISDDSRIESIVVWEHEGR